jgi:autotransporter-associated beta strand protein
MTGITTTWKQSPFFTADYNDPSNWNAGVPGSSDTAEFEASNATNITIDDIRHVGQWVFNPGATQYNFDIAGGATLFFDGSGITINSGSAHIFDFGHVGFLSSSTAGAALIDDFGLLDFRQFSNAGTATIHTYGGGFASGIPGSSAVFFFDNATGGSAQFVTDAGGVVDFSPTSGPDGLGHVTAGSIAGAGTYDLGGDQLMVGLNGLSTEVSGPINDGGSFGHSGASLFKVGPGTLRLSHAGNTYSGGTFLAGGKLDVAAVGAVGPGAITFAGNATLKIENMALTAHHFDNAIDLFARHDFIDLAGLKFHAGASATYHKANHHLTVHSGTVTDTLTLVSPHGAHFIVAGDGHGGTDVLLHA